MCNILERHSNSIGNVALDHNQPIIASVVVSGHSAEICLNLLYQLSVVRGVGRLELLRNRLQVVDIELVELAAVLECRDFRGVEGRG